MLWGIIQEIRRLKIESNDEGECMVETEYIVRKVKDLIPWKARYWLKFQEAKYPGMIPAVIKQKSDPKVYNLDFYKAMSGLGITDFAGKVFCEMGCGQFLSHVFLAYQLGASSSYLLEIDDFAGQDKIMRLDRTFKLQDGLKKIKKLPRPDNGSTWRDYLGKLNATYYTNGMDGYKAIADESVDYVMSFTVFEHIRKNVFKETLEELYRFLKWGGSSYHVVDLKDHLGGSKNNLRFPESVWEDETHYRMDNYTNRLSCTEICQICSEIGFKVNVMDKMMMEKKFIIDRKKIDPMFQKMTDEDLKMGAFVMVLKKE